MNELDTLNTEEAAEYLKCSKSTLINLMHDTDPKIRPPGVKVGKSWVFVRCHLVDYLKNRCYGGELSQIAPTSTKKKEKRSCRSIKERTQKTGISNSSSEEEEEEYLKALGLKKE